MESARSMYCAKNLSPKLWAEAVQTAVYVLNRTGTSTIKGKTPYELWHGTPASIDNFRIFGSEVYVHIPKQSERNWVPKPRSAFSWATMKVKRDFESWMSTIASQLLVT